MAYVWLNRTDIDPLRSKDISDCCGLDRITGCSSGSMALG